VPGLDPAAGRGAAARRARRPATATPAPATAAPPPTTASAHTGPRVAASATNSNAAPAVPAATTGPRGILGRAGAGRAAAGRGADGGGVGTGAGAGPVVGVVIERSDQGSAGWPGPRPS
jgi:hypothetical protein